MMNLVYVLVPLAQINPSCSIVLVEQCQQNYVEEILDSSCGKFQIIHSHSERQFYVRIKQLNLSFLEINTLLQEKEKVESKIKILKNVLQSQNTMHSSQITNQKSITQSMHFDELIKKANKSKQLKEENKKLKKLLQVQLENTEKVREETQKTMKKLKQEFDALVFQMAIKQNSTQSNDKLNHNRNKR